MTLVSKPLKKLIEYKATSIQDKIQRKMKFYQEKKTCDNTKFLVYDFINYNIDECGLGCQLHGFSSGLLCGIENDRQFFIVNFVMDQYKFFFKFFNTWCQINHEKNAGKLGKFFL